MANFTGGKLANNEARDFTHVFKLTYEDLENIGNGGQETLFAIPAGGALDKIIVYEAVAVAGTTTLIIDIGTTAIDPDDFIDALDVAAMTASVANTGDAFTAAQNQPVGLTQTATDVLLEVTDANIANITAGEIIVAVNVLDPGRFASAKNG